MSSRHPYFHKIPQILNFTCAHWHSLAQVHAGVSWIFFFLFFDDVIVLLLFIFIIFVELCWKTRLLILSLCPCDSFLIFRLPICLIYLFSYFVLEGYDAILWLPVAFCCCSEWQPRWIYLPDDRIDLLFLRWLTTINFNLNCDFDLVVPWIHWLLSHRYSWTAIPSLKNITLLLRGHLTELERDEKLRHLGVADKSLYLY